MRQTVYLIRHGHTEGTTKKVMYGATELKLTEAGKAEIAELREKGAYPSAEGAVLYTSGMVRTEQTFEIIYGDIEHGTRPALKEINMGILEMTALEEVLKTEWGKAWLSGSKPDFVIEGGESQNGFVERVQNGMRELVEDTADEEKVIVVCHGGVIAWIMDGLFPGADISSWEWTPDPAKGYAVDFEDGQPVAYRALGAV